MIKLQIASNIDLVQAVNSAIAESGYQKSYIAEQLGCLLYTSPSPRD